MRKIIILCAVCVALSAALMIWGFAEEPEQPRESKKYIALMTEDRGTDAMQFKQGAQLAANEQSAELSIRAVSVNEPRTETLLSMLDGLSREAFDGLIVPPCEGPVYEKAAALAAEKNAALVCLWDAADGQAISVRTDRRRQGAQIAEGMLASGARPGAVYVYLEEDRGQSEMLEGLREALSVEKVEVIVGGDAVPPGALPCVEENAFVALGPELTEALCRAVGGRSRVWGVDPGESRAELLEEKMAAGLSMEMPYIRGYLAVEAMRASGDDLPAAMDCPTRVVTEDTMYDSENVKLVFPLIQ